MEGQVSHSLRVVLVNLVLSAMPLFLMSIAIMPKWVRTKLDRERRRFFQTGHQVSPSKYNLVSQGQICKSKDFGRLIVLDLQTMNLALMAKWWWLLVSRPNGTLQCILWSKYGPRKGQGRGHGSGSPKIFLTPHRFGKTCLPQRMFFTTT